MDFLFDLLLAVAEIFLEALFELAGEAVLDLALRALGEVFESVDRANPVLASLGYAILGSLAGGVSLFVFPHPLVRPSRVHGISLLVSPVVTGLLMSFIGASLRHQGKGSSNRELWLRLCFCSRNGSNTLLFCSLNPS
jgi:hypothetical protein